MEKTTAFAVSTCLCRFEDGGRGGLNPVPLWKADSLRSDCLGLTVVNCCGYCIKCGFSGGLCQGESLCFSLRLLLRRPFSLSSPLRTLLAACSRFRCSDCSSLRCRFCASLLPEQGFLLHLFRLIASGVAQLAHGTGLLQPCRRQRGWPAAKTLLNKCTAIHFAGDGL